MNADEHFQNLLMLPHEDLLGYFLKFREELKNYRVVLFSPLIDTVPKKLRDSVNDEVSMLSLSPNNQFFVLDYNTSLETFVQNGKSNIGLSGCVHFDTQIVSYLRQIYSECNKSKEVYDTYLFLKKLLEDKIDFIDDLYMFENSYKIDDEKTNKYMYECFLAYEHFKKTDEKQFELEFGRLDIFTNEDHNVANKTMLFCKKIKDLDTPVKEFFDITHCILLKLACLKFSSKKSPENQFKVLNEFVINNIGVYLERELAVCYLYLKHSEKVEKFFKKFQRGCNNLLGVIQGMAWDLTHIRCIEYFMWEDQKENKNFYNHYMVTYDRGLRDVLCAFPIDRIVFNNDFSQERFEKPLSIMAADTDIANMYSATQEYRVSVRKNRDLKELKAKLINELTNIIV